MRKGIANLLFVFFGLPLALSALMLLSVRPWGLDRETYKRFVQDDRLYSALQAPEIARRAPRTLKLGPASFDGPALTAAVQKNLPIPEIKATAAQAVDRALDAVESAGPGALELDLQPLKAALRSKGPALTRDYAAALAAARPPEVRTALSPPQELNAALGAAVDRIPDRPSTGSLSLPAPRTSGLGRLGDTIGSLSRGNEALSQAILNRMTATMAAASALLLAGLGALGGRSALTRLSRAGRYLLLPSLAVLLLGIVLAVPGGLILNTLPLELRGMLGGAGGAALKAYLASALGPIARDFFLTGLIGASLGGVLAGARRIAEPKELE